MALLLAVAIYRYQNQHQDDNAASPSLTESLRQSSFRLFETVRSSCSVPSTASTADCNTDDANSVHSRPSFTRSTPSFSATSMSISTFADVTSGIRNEWIDAVFGPDIFHDDRPPPRQGIGLAQVPSYVSYQCTIPSARRGDDDKVGVTLSRIALGIYVSAVAKNSPACFAKVCVNSILVEINGMGMLGEPFRQGVERLSQYDRARNDATTETTTPVKLVFYRAGQLYHVLILSPPPYGISWAPCGDFALVQRSYAYAAEAGVLRGCLVAAVNGASLRTMDHEGTAARLRDGFIAGKPMNVSLVYTPAASRTVYYDKQKERTTPIKKGVDVREQPVEYSIGQLFMCGTSAGAISEEPLSQRMERGTAPQMIDGVLRLAPRYTPCPPLEDWLTQWDLLDALVFILQAANSAYDDDTLSVSISKSRDQSTIATLLAMMSSEDAWRLANTFLLQWVSILCKSDEGDDKDVASVVLTLSRRDEAFCQRLYFLLRSYTATLEGQRSRQENNTRNLLTLLQALDRLRFAQKQLTTQLTTSVVEVATPTSEAAYCLVTASERTVPLPEAAPSKKSKKFRVFRKKGKAHKTTPAGLPLIMAQESLKSSSLKKLSIEMEYLSVPSLLENMSRFLTELDSICDDIERSLLKSFSQKIADWALQPWSASKGTALAKVTEGMRDGMLRATADGLSLVNPLEASEVLVSLRTSECFVLPSAHFPLLLTFDVKNNESTAAARKKDEQIYRTRVKVVALRGAASSSRSDRVYIVQAGVSGVIKESGRSSVVNSHVWDAAGELTFDTLSSWGAPKTLCLRLSSVPLDQEGQDQVAHTDDNGKLHYTFEEGFCWVDMVPMWKRDNGATVSCHAQIWSLEATEGFDQHGDLMEGLSPVPERLELELKITTEIVAYSDSLSRSRMLLYKHDDDVRQEMFAIQFIETCDMLLKASGLDLKLLTFRCVAVGAKRGFIQWVPGSVPLSDICLPDLIPTKGVHSTEGSDKMDQQDNGTISQVAKAGLTKYQSLYRIGLGTKKGERNSLANNSIQDFLRSVAYDGDAPYLIRREVMDTFVKSCAGYSVLTYILGVGDRHLDNLLLHHSGHFFHCDYSFILGNDPKKYLPMRITEDMVNGMGGRDSDNYAKFLSLAGAAFVALRRHGNVRVILTLVRLMVPSALPDVSVIQNADQVLYALRDRLRLDLSDNKAIAYMEGLIESSISSKMWLAVDAIHRLGKRF